MYEVMIRYCVELSNSLKQTDTVPFYSNDDNKRKLMNGGGGLTLVFVFHVRLKFEFHNNETMHFHSLQNRGLNWQRHFSQPRELQMEHSFGLIMSADTQNASRLSISTDAFIGAVDRCCKRTPRENTDKQRKTLKYSSKQ